MTTKPVDDEIQLLSNADNITLEQIDHYLSQRRNRTEKSKNTTQDFVFGLIAELIVSQENEAVELDPYKGIKVNQPEGLKQELKLIAARENILNRLKYFHCFSISICGQHYSKFSTINIFFYQQWRVFINDRGYFIFQFITILYQTFIIYP